MLNETHNPEARSWVESSTQDGVDFPIQNLPYCAFKGADGSVHLGTGIGVEVLDLHACIEAGLLDSLDARTQFALQQQTLNDFMSLGRRAWKDTRQAIFDLLMEGSSAKESAAQILVAREDITMVMPMVIGDFTDFECSHHHAVRMRKLMSGASKPLVNGYYLPRAYHGRSSSVVLSGEPVYLPHGQIERENETPVFKECEQFDYELELGIVIGEGNERGEPIPIEEAEDHIFGFCIVNDWSARDVQRWERLPLGPFLGKNHQTFISPWIVTVEALAPFRAPQEQNIEGRPPPFDYLDSAQDRSTGAIDIDFKVTVSSDQMRESEIPPYTTSRNSFLDATWSISQIIAHHTSGGCNLRPGDLIGSGTVSGEAEQASACLMELTEVGRKPFTLPTGEKRGFLEVGDDVTFKAYSKKEDYPLIGFGICRGRVQPPRREQE